MAEEFSEGAEWVIVTNHYVVDGERNIEVCWAVTQTCRDARAWKQGSDEFDISVLDYERFMPDKETWSWLWEVALKDWKGWGSTWEKGDVVYAAGYPGKTTDWNGKHRIPTPVVAEGTVYQDSTAFKKVGNSGETLYTGHYIEHSAEISLGNSGGPLMSADGWTIGVNSAASLEPKQIEGAIPMSYVLYWIETGEEPQDALALRTEDGGIYAVLTWTQNGTLGWHY